MIPPFDLNLKLIAKEEKEWSSYLPEKRGKSIDFQGVIQD